MQLDEMARADMDWIYPTRDSAHWCVSNAGRGESSRALVGSYVLQWKTQVTVWQCTVGYTSTTRMPPDVLCMGLPHFQHCAAHFCTVPRDFSFMYGTSPLLALCSTLLHRAQGLFFYVWDFPASSTVQHTSAQSPGTFLSPRTFGFHKRLGYLTRRAAVSFSRKTLHHVVILFSCCFFLNFMYRFKST